LFFAWEHDLNIIFIETEERHSHQRFYCVRMTVMIRHGHHVRRRFFYLFPNEENHMSVALSVGHKVTCTLTFMDQFGNPMLVTPVPDALPAWTDITPATGTLTAAPDGLSATEVAIAAGTDTISVALAVGGVAFKASVDLAVTAAPQVLTTIGILATVA
jgi:hypothetical protein